MNSVDSGSAQLLSAIGLLVLGGVITAVLKFLFDRVSAQLGWSREDKRAQDGKIERVDSTARTDLARLEREVKQKLNEHGEAIARLDERVKHLPTADDMERLTERLSGVESGLAGATAKIDGQSEMVRTIRDHILRGER